MVDPAIEQLNTIRINIGELRMQLSALQKDGFNEIGLYDMLVFLHVYFHTDEILGFMAGPTGGPIPLVNPLRAGAGAGAPGSHTAPPGTQSPTGDLTTL